MSISAEDRATLVSLARRAVEAQVRGQAPPKVEGPGELLRRKRGCFVTLTNGGRLRGCIGTFTPGRLLGEMVVEMGAAAAQDPRFVFDRITPTELGELSVEVSVLSPLEETAEPEKLEIGTHGIYIVGRSSGCFLPEVAVEMAWTAEEFLDHCCASKAGLPTRAWKEPGTKVYLFTTEKFDH
ncbi:MAG TPA: AmmeMemoRadiSam system protein A [Phycisphaerae bacterium]|nr:AmmeMemoRadiSam system protein A [Phycisphaerae bacterium]